jgi:hypothetical protein
MISRWASFRSPVPNRNLNTFLAEYLFSRVGNFFVGRRLPTPIAREAFLVVSLAQSGDHLENNPFNPQNSHIQSKIPPPRRNPGRLHISYQNCADNRPYNNKHRLWRRIHLGPGSCHTPYI